LGRQGQRQTAIDGIDISLSAPGQLLATAEAHAHCQERFLIDRTDLIDVVRQH
jgi:hypothetical protein